MIDRKIDRWMHTRPAYRDASIYRSTLIWASVHVILRVGFTAVLSQWALDFLCNFLNLCMVYLKFHSNKFFNLAVVDSLKIICVYKKL